MTANFTDTVVDFVIIGSGAAGGVIARELSRAGHSVVVLEQGPWRQADDFTHDEWSVMFRQEFSGRERRRLPDFPPPRAGDRRAARPASPNPPTTPAAWAAARHTFPATTGACGPSTSRSTARSVITRRDAR
jgi:choline dehydrogenase-like flavoprotein